MRLTTSRLAVPLITCLALATACSGDDEGDGGSGDGPGGDQSSSAGAGDEATDNPTDRPTKQVGGTKTRPCTVEVSVTGAVEKSWRGKGEVRLQDVEKEGSAPKAVYSTTKGDARFVVYSSGPGFNASLTFSQGEVAYSGAPAGGTDINARGTGAVVEQALDGAGNKQAQVSAEFTCGGKKPKKG